MDMMEEEKQDNAIVFGLQKLAVHRKVKDCCEVPNKTIIERAFQSRLQKMRECEIFVQLIGIEFLGHLALKTNTYSKEYMSATVGKTDLGAEKLLKIAPLP